MSEKIELTLVELLRKLKDDGTLDLLFRHGFITAKPYLCIDTYFKVEALQLSMPKTKAVQITAEHLHVSTRTVFSYLASLN